MKKLLVALTLFSLITAGAMAYGHGMGGWGGYGMGFGYGGHMMGYGHMGPMMGGYGYDQKFLDETRELRKQLHEKMFEYQEAIRDPKTTPETVTALEKEIYELKEKIYDKSPRKGFRDFCGCGYCW